MEKELVVFGTLQAKYEDMGAECLTLRQTNGEFKKCLAGKVKEIMNLKKEIEILKKA